MAGKRKKSGEDGSESGGEGIEERDTKKMKQEKEAFRPSMIKNKEKRSAIHAKLKQQKKVDKRKKVKAREAAERRALELGEEPPPKKTPRTIENTRELDETICKPDDDELFAGNDADEFNDILKQERIPKVLITTCRFNSTRGPGLASDLLSIIPNSHYYRRGTYDLKKIVEYAKNRDFTSVMVIHTSRREPVGNNFARLASAIDNLLLRCYDRRLPAMVEKITGGHEERECLQKDAVLIIGLPDGPTAHFKLSNLVLHKDLKNHGNPTSHKPELVLTNFTTRLGHRVGRLIQSLFPQDPNFRGRRVVTFHNQRDFIFFRHHRYIFETKESKQVESKSKDSKDNEESNAQKKAIARLQECGPRFTLKLTSLQHGTFDTKDGEYEWVHKPEMDTSRRRFFL